jgi:hypothetical protein
MKKLLAMLFAVVACATAFVPVALANNGRDHNGNPGQYDNCTGWYNGQGNDGPNWHACD